MDRATRIRIQCVLPLLNERQRRLYLAAEVNSLGHGGLKDVHELTGVAKSTILLGKKELQMGGEGGTLEVDKARKEGGGRNLITQKYADLPVALEKIMEKLDVEDSEQVLMWTTKSLRDLERVLAEQRFKISHDMIGNLLHAMGYSLRQDQKMAHFSGSRPDSLVQFLYIAKKCWQFIREGCPVVSVVTSKKELVGDFRRSLVECGKMVSGKEGGLLSGFPVEALGKVAFYDVHEISSRLGFVNLGFLSGDGLVFEVESLLRWWQTLGCHTFSGVKKFYVISDGGGCGSGLRFGLWRKQLQVLADVSGLEIHVSYFPPGTSKWKTVGHEMFCFINDGKDVVAAGDEAGLGVSVEANIKLISNVAALKKLQIVCVRDSKKVVLDVNVGDDEDLSEVNLVRDECYGNWNYIITPK
ncbi:MAG: ISAzo13 family transposase [Candidatus Bathyarchaeota archaeon]|nr:ISAzo13 family transposase [Candidatus Termiticorpusculum sp.]